MKQLSKQVKLAAMGGAICTLLVASVYAVEIERSANIQFPGVDRAGNLDQSLGAFAVAKVVVDTNTRTFVARGFPVVKNELGRKITFYNTFTPSIRALAQRLGQNPNRILITTDIYYVDEPFRLFSSDANARASVKGEIR